MTKVELVNELAAKTGLTKKQVTAVLDAFMEVLTDSLAKTGEFRLGGLGRFVGKVQKPRKVNLFGTGKVATTSKKPAVRFKAAKALLEAVAKYHRL